jgi:hypothetical protein
MVTNGKRLLVTEIPIDYTRSSDQIKQVERLLEKYGNKKKY